MRRLVCGRDDVFAALARGRGARDEATERTVAAILADVRERGDAALLDSARRFDAPGLASLRVTSEELETATLDRRPYEALRTALWRVRRFHIQQLEVMLGSVYGFSTAHMSDVLELRTPRPSIVARWAIGERPSPDPRRFPTAPTFGVGQIVRSLDAAGVYVPGGGASYPSSVVMNVTPAAAAMVPRIAVTTPARPDGTLSPAVLVALRDAGADEAYKVGGAAAIAALAYGTESVARVDKIAGPGNRFVNEAKRQLWGIVGLDGYAGPSEVLVIADAAARPEVVATDLLTQIEHAPDNAAYLVGVGPGVVDAVLAAAEAILAEAPRAATMRAALEGGSYAVEARDLDEAVAVANAVACEHVSLAVANPERALRDLRHAGCVLLGESSPEAAGDYVAGPSHTLPTNGAARWQSPVNAMDFLKFQSVIGLSAEELRELAPAIAEIGALEGLPLHGGAGLMRLDPAP